MILLAWKPDAWKSNAWRAGTWRTAGEEPQQPPHPVASYGTALLASALHDRRDDDEVLLMLLL